MQNKDACKPDCDHEVWVAITVILAILFVLHCAIPENIHTLPTEGIGISWGGEGSVRPKNVKKCMKLNWNFQRGWGGGSGKKIPSMGKVWIFSGMTHSSPQIVEEKRDC